MNKIVLKKDSYDKFILRGSLALECYNDMNSIHEDLYINFNNKLKKYRSLKEKTMIDKEQIVNELLFVIEQIGIDNFIIYDDGYVECKRIDK